MEWLTESEVNTVIAAPKFVKETIVWQQKRDTFTYMFRVPLASEPELPLTLEGSYNAKTGYITLKIMYNGTQRVKCLDIGRTHRNPNGERIGRLTKKHKHSWKDEYQDQWVYDPMDITTGAPGEQVFAEFLVECNISYDSRFLMPSRQMGLDL